MSDMRVGFGLGMSLFAVVANPITTSSPTGSGSDFRAGVYTKKEFIRLKRIGYRKKNHTS